MTAVVGVLWAALQSWLVWMLSPLSPPLVVQQLCFTPQALQSVFDQWGPQGLALYRSHFPYDLFNPLLYGSLGWLLVRRTRLFAGCSRRAQRWAAALLPLAGLFDWLENAAQLHILDQLPALDARWVAASASFSALKWMLSACFVLWLVARVWTRARHAE